MTVDPSLEKLRAGDYEGAWSVFMDRHRRLLFAVVRRYVADPDDVMDAFAHACEQLRADEFARLKRYTADEDPRASFSTWLVVVTRNLVIDWLRARDVHRTGFAAGRPSPARGHAAVAVAEHLTNGSTGGDFAIDARRIAGEVLNGLDAEVRAAVQLFVVEEMSAADVARAVGWQGEKAVHNKVYRTLASIRENVAKRGIAT